MPRRIEIPSVALLKAELAEVNRRAAQLRSLLRVAERYGRLSKSKAAAVVVETAPAETAKADGAGI